MVGVDGLKMLENSGFNFHSSFYFHHIVYVTVFSFIYIPGSWGVCFVGVCVCMCVGVCVVVGVYVYVYGCGCMYLQWVYQRWQH